MLPATLDLPGMPTLKMAPIIHKQRIPRGLQKKKTSNKQDLVNVMGYLNTNL
jgi:hypothetical protein